MNRRIVMERAGERRRSKKWRERRATKSQLAMRAMTTNQSRMRVK